MGMKKDSLFVKQIFQLADKDESGYLSFKEFRDLIAILMKGYVSIPEPINFKNCNTMKFFLHLTLSLVK